MGDKISIHRTKINLHRAMGSYPDIYSLKPHYETEPGWFKLKWKPLWKKTFNLYKESHSSYFGFALYSILGGAHNGWGRSYDRLDIYFLIFKWRFSFWVKWNYIVMGEGPMDMGFDCPLNIDHLVGKSGKVG